MKKVLVTGASGFIGNYVVNELLKYGVNVIATSVKESKARAADWFSKVEYKRMDLNEFQPEVDYVKYFGNPDSLIHLAWEGLPDYKSLAHFEQYLPLHYSFLKNLVVNGCRDITVTGTCFEYGMKTGKLSESDVAEPSNPYGLAKFTLLRFLEELKKKEDFNLKWVRLFYMYGKGQNERSVIPQLEKAIVNNDAQFNMSGGEQVRDFLPVEKVASHICKIAMQSKTEGVINCCSGIPVKLKDLVNEYIASRNSSIKLNLGYYSYPDYEPMSFWGDNQKLQKILNEQ